MAIDYKNRIDLRNLSDSDYRLLMQAMIAEGLGELLKLNDEIKALPDAIAVELGALTEATKNAKVSVETSAEAEKVSLQKLAATERTALREAVRTAFREEASEVLGATTRALKNAADMHERDMAAWKSQDIRVWLYGALIGLGSAGIAVGAIYLLTNFKFQ